MTDLPSSLPESATERPVAPGRLTALRRLLHGPSRRCRQRILILGQPKSGTTALFYSVRQALRYVPALFEPQAPATIDPAARPLLVKALADPRRLPDLLSAIASFDRRVLLLRDPRDRMVSSFFYQLYHARFAADPAAREGFLSLLRQKEQSPASLDFAALCAWVKEQGGHDFFRFCANGARKFARFVETSGEGFFKLTYEDLVAGRLAPLGDYLGVALRPPEGGEEALARVRRTAAAGDWRNWLTERDVAALRADLDPVLERLGYAADWELNAPKRLDPAYGSAYAERLLAARAARAS